MIELKGVEILQTIESNPITFAEFRIFIIAFIIFITLFGLVLGWIKECPLKGLVGGFIVSLVVAFPVTLIQFIKPEKTYYKVKLSEEVNMPEFLEHYIIIRQEGSILVVETINK